MKDLIVFFAGFAFFCINALSQVPVTGWISFDQQGSTSQLVPGSFLKEESTKGILINFNIPGMMVHEIKKNGRIFQRLSIPGHGLSTDIGKPELPVIGQVVEIPLNAQVRIEIYKEKHTILSGYTVYPAQKARFNQVSDTGIFVIDSATYTSNTNYPQTLSIIEPDDIAIIRGHRILFLKVNPVQYNPVKKELTLYSNIEVRVTYDKPTQVDYVDRRKYSPAFEQLYKALIINYRDPGHLVDKNIGLIVQGSMRSASEYAEDLQYSNYSGATYLILTHQSLYNSSDPNNAIVKFEKWKKSKGYVTRVVTTNMITDGTTANGIKTYLQNAYDTWDLPPAYVLLIGDSDSLPTNYKTDHPWEEYNGAKIGTDLYYSTLDGDDYLPDILTGRISADNTSQADIALTKIINYEKNPPANSNFYKNILLAGLFEDVYPRETDASGNIIIKSNGTEDNGRAWIECLEDMNNYFSASYNPRRIYAYNGNFANGAQKYENGDPLPSALLASSGFPWNGTSANISDSLNSTDGISFTVFRDHGWRTGWYMPNFSNGNINALTNGTNIPIVFSVACETGWFDNETDDDVTLDDHSTTNATESFCETFIRKSNGGTQAIIGASRVSYSGYNDFLAFGFLKAIWSDYNPHPALSDRFPNLPSLSVSSLNRMGQIHNYGKLFLEKSYRDEDEEKIKVEFEMFHLFGDPEMIIYSKQPGNLKVDHPLKIGSSGHQHFMVHVSDFNLGTPLQGAQVVLLYDNQILRSEKTDPAGNAVFAINSPLSEDIEIIVTSDVYRTFEGIIGVSADGAMINRMDPNNGIINAPFNVGGINFLASEAVEIYINSTLMQTVTADADGSFGQAGVENISITIPSSFSLGPVTVIAHGKTSDRYAAGLYIIRTQNPVDLHMYAQQDESTWYINPGDNPVWDNPDIQLFSGNNPVSSGDLHIGTPYTVRATIRNTTGFFAQNVNVSFSWANFGAGGPFTNIQNGSVTIDVPAHGTATASIAWTPGVKGHICIRAAIYHIEDINSANNKGQENCTVGKAASPFETTLEITNPTDRSSYMFLDVRQRSLTNRQRINKFWNTEITWPEEQLLKPDESKEVKISIDPDKVFAAPGDKVWFNVTGYINNKMVGGIDIKVEKKLYKTFSVHTGFGFPLGDFLDDYKQGYYLKLDYINPILNRTYVHIIGGLNTFKAESATSNDESILSLDAYINRKVYFWRTWNIFLEAGPGYYRSKLNGSAAGISAGSGIAVPISKKLELGINSYYHKVFESVNAEFLDAGIFVNYLF